MKKINKYIAIIAVFGILFASCTKVLDVTPKLQISDATALTTPIGLETAVVGAYDRLQSGYLYGGRIWVGGDMLADNVKKSGDYALVYEEIQMVEKNLSADNLITAVLWSDGYNVIYIVNAVLQAIPSVYGGAVSDESKRIEGECLFIRSLVYFDLMRYLGNPNNNLAVPLILVPQSISEQPPRATIDEIYAQIIPDLEKAVTLLPESNNNHATSYAAEALLSRVYFYHREYDKAALAATSVIESGKFSLVDSVAANYQDMTITSEMIFVMMSTQLDPSCGTLNGYYRQASPARFIPSNGLIKTFLFTGGINDQRYTKLFKLVNGKLYTTKFDNRYMNVPVIRLAELYLTRAECRVEAGDITGAQEDVNVIRARAGLPNITSTAPDKLKLDIYYERAKELFFEGDNFFNQKRLEKAEISDLKLPWTSPRLLYKVPQREIDVNPNLIQN
jgi:hypothetical protein